MVDCFNEPGIYDAISQIGNALLRMRYSMSEDVHFPTSLPCVAFGKPLTNA